MSGRYVPTHLRHQGGSKVEGDAPPPKPRRLSSFDDGNGLVSAEEIRNHFWPSSDHTDGRFSTVSSGSKTLHDSAETPGRLAYLFLFRDANPRWETDQTVYTKSSLEMLPPASENERPEAGQRDKSNLKTALTQSSGTKDPSPDKPGATEEASVSPGADDNTFDPNAAHPPVRNGDRTAPVAVFKETRHHPSSRSFAFEGWYRIDRITYLEPNSQELHRMLDQKWTRTDRRGHEIRRERDSSAWQASLSMRWAVVKFVRHAEAQEERGVPSIERLPDPSEEKANGQLRKKSVNEMLKGMRVGDGEVKKASVEA